ncbi:MAG: hypothetical protein JKY70_22840 [Mucilaginibacter sp.]|nr:hypothetical protein [Mucilaginibacter sp.]
MKKLIKIILFSGVIIVVLLLALVIILPNIIGPLNPKYYKVAELTENFNKKRKEIYEVKRYFKALAPQYKDVDIEFDGNKIARLEIMPRDTGKGSNLAVEFLDWNIPVGSKKSDSLMKVLGWNNAKLKALQDKLDKANCISITNTEPAKIGFKRSGFGMYFFNVFDKPLGDSLRTKYNDSCTYIYVNRNLVLEYGGGAIGPQCFSEFK